MARFTPQSNTHDILALAADWRDRCLIGDGSMLGETAVWTLENARGFVTYFVDAADPGGIDFMAKFRVQLEGAPAGVKWLAAEMVWFVYLFPHKQPGPGLRRERVREIWSWAGSALPASDMIADATFEGIANTSRAFTSKLYEQLTFLGRVIERLKEMPTETRAALVRDGDPFQFAVWLDTLKGAAKPAVRHVLLYFCFPDSFERIVSYGHKQKIVQAFGTLPPSRSDGQEDTVAIDRELLRIRREKEEQLGPVTVDFYVAPLRGQWLARASEADDDPGVATPSKDEVKTMTIRRIVTRDPTIQLDSLIAKLAQLGLNIKKSTIGTIRSDVLSTIKAARAEGRWRDEVAQATASPLPTEELSEDSDSDDDEDEDEPIVDAIDARPGLHHLAECFMPETVATRMLAALGQRKNIIVQGAPGVGKTFAARRLARALGAPQDAIEEVQFHQSYGYEDFIEGFRPGLGGFELRPGRLALICRAAVARPRVPHVLIIDEINRGNISRILGEAMVLIEADKRGEEHALLLAQSGTEFSVPPNVHLIGLMNTADRSLAMVDYAVRRRFSFFTIEPAFDALAFLRALRAAGVSESMIARIRQRFTTLNAKIAADTISLGPGYCIGHSHFLGSAPAGDDAGWFRDIIDSQVAPLLREYWADQPVKAVEEVAVLLEGV